MLDTKDSWDHLIGRHAPDAATRDAILANPLYQNITGRFVQSHDYIAMERLYEIHSSGRYDLVVVDTPPSRNALDFLDAPQRMADFFGSRLLRWLTVPYRSRMVTLASKPFYNVADRILGTKFLEDIAEFFSLFQSMESGFRKRAKEVSRILSDRRTTFCVVSTLEPAPLAEAEFFVEALYARKLPLGAVVLNKVLPQELFGAQAAAAARVLRSDAVPLSASLAPVVGSTPEQVARVLTTVASSFHDFQVVAKREAEQRAELATGADVLVTVPVLDEPVNDLAGLVRLGRCCWR
jgi:anion-transporting  ArsA/GET3 family ATPase